MNWRTYCLAIAATVLVILAWRGACDGGGKEHDELYVHLTTCAIPTSRGHAVVFQLGWGYW